MKNNILYILITLLPLNAFSDTSSEKTWQVGSTFIHAVKSKKLGLIVNPSCAKTESPESCKAIAEAMKVSLKKIDKDDFRGGKNPGAVLCHHISKAYVLIGADSAGNQNSFCVFDDGSLISCGSLLQKAISNDSI